MKKRILCFGDSNTWGFDPHDGSRQEKRFTRLLMEEHPEWEVIEEGHNGRTLAAPDPYSMERVGSRQIQSAIHSAMPLDCIVIMLGTNDAKRMFGLNEFTYERALCHFLDQAMDPRVTRALPYDFPPVLLIQPAKLNEKALDDEKNMATFGQDGKKMLDHTGSHLESAAKIYGCDVLRTDGTDGFVLEGSAVDGIHFEKEQHALLAQHLGRKIEEILSR